MNVYIRPALPEEAERLTEIGFAAKGHWNYPPAYYEIWREELTITPAYIRDNTVLVAESEGEAAGYCSLVEVPEDFTAGNVPVRQGHWLEHIFVLPARMGQGIGRKMAEHALAWCRERKIPALLVFSDPNAAGFYTATGAEYLEESPSSIPGRTVPLFQYRL